MLRHPSKRAAQLLFNPFDVASRADPYAHYQALRNLDSVHRSPLGFWVLSRYEDVRIAQTDQRLQFLAPQIATAMERIRRPPRPRAAGLLSAFEYWHYLTDPAAHKRFRAVVTQCLSPRRLEAMRPRVTSVIAALLEPHAGCSQFDVIRDFTSWLPVAVMTELFGLSPAHRAQYRAWSATMGRVLEPTIDLSTIHHLVATLTDCQEHLSVVVSQRRRQLGDDLISAMLQLDVDGHPVTDADVVAYVTILLGAGYETTANLIANSLLALVRNPDQLRLLQRNPDLIEPAVEELARFDSPVQLHSRWAIEHIRFGDHTVDRGARLVLLIGSANRDPARFHHPDELELARRDEGSLSFGRGARYCLGAPLARLQVETALQLFLTRFANVGLPVEGPVWRTEYVALRALSRLTLPIRS